MTAEIAWIDTSALVALATPKDQNHKRAVDVARTFRTRGGLWMSSVLVLAEFHRHALFHRGPAFAREKIKDVLSDPAHTWREVSSALADAALSAWLERFDDQDFSLADAVSFELMKREGLTQAFAFDQHYLIAGFQLLQ